MVPKVRVAPAIVLAHYFECRGLNFKAAALTAGLSSDDLASHLNFIPLRVFARLLDSISRQSGGERVLTRLVEDATGSSSGLVGHLALRAPNVRTFLQCLAAFSPLFVTGVDVGFAEADGAGTLYWRMPPGIDAPLDLVSLFAVTVIAGRIRSACGPGWMPQTVEFEHKEFKRRAELELVLGKRLMFDAGRTCLHLDASTLAKPMPNADAEMFGLHINHAQLLMKDLEIETDLVSRVAAEVTARLHEENLTLDEVAYAIRLTPRSLQRRLEQSGTTFERVLDGSRRNMAERLLRETDRPLMQIAFDIGYRSQSAFSRAVRRWLSLTPRDYRQRCRSA